MAKKSLLNVKRHLELTSEICSNLIEDNKKYNYNIGPIYLDALRDLDFFSRMILRKHNEKKTRKDIYINAK